MEGLASAVPRGREQAQLPRAPWTRDRGLRLPSARSDSWTLRTRTDGSEPLRGRDEKPVKKEPVGDFASLVGNPHAIDLAMAQQAWLKVNRVPTVDA